MTVDGQPRRYEGTLATPDLFRILGIAPALGRDFEASDDRPGAEKVAIISHGAWQRDFGGAANILGRAVRLNGAPATIIGVMPKGFAFPYRQDVWVPLHSQFPVLARNDPRDRAGAVLALVKPDVSLDAANAEVTSFAKRFSEAYPDTNKRYSSGLVVPLIQRYTPNGLKGTLLTMLGFCVGVLLIACVNVMNMQFARATLRAKELAVRSSLGATRGRLIRQMLTESILVATAGAALGIPLAYEAADWLWATVHSMQYGPPTWMTFDIDARVLALTVAATAAAAVVVRPRARVDGVARRHGRRAARPVARQHRPGRGAGDQRPRRLPARGDVRAARRVPAAGAVDRQAAAGGLRVRHERRAVGEARPDGCAATRRPRRASCSTTACSSRCAARPSSALPPSPTGCGWCDSGTTRIEIDGKAYKQQRDRPVTNWEMVSSGFTEVIGQPVIEGRAIADDDLDSKRPVAVVNEAFARRHFGRDSAVGRRFRTVTDDEQPGPWRTIVGVSRTVRMLGIYNSPLADGSGFYVPFYGTLEGPASPVADPAQFATVVVRPRATVPAESMVSALRRAIEKVDRDLPLYYIGTPAQHYDAALAQNRVIAGMFSTFGLVSVLMASVGLYGVMSFSVNRRRQEFGVRMALGADRRAIVGIVLRRGLRQIALGLTIGFALAFVLATIGRDVLSGMLYSVNGHDPFSYVVVFAVVAVVSLVAAVVPALRAARVHPMTALRAE